jgi:hypothetical protein
MPAAPTKWGKMTPYLVGAFRWGAFIVSWYAAIAWTAKAVERTSLSSRVRDYLF